MSEQRWRATGRPVVPADQLAELTARVEALGLELECLRRSLADEVRTQRVVVVEADGFERLVLAGQHQFGHVTLRSRTADGHPTCVELFANDPIDGAPAHVGTALTARGEVVAAFELTEPGGAAWWIDRGNPPDG